MNKFLVLLVEDDPDERELALRAIQSSNANCELVAAKDGVEALDLLFSNETQPGRRLARPPDLILLDLNLPKIPGLELLRRIKADERTCRIPVVVLTGSDWALLDAESRRLGAAECIPKPITPLRLNQLATRFGRQS